MSQYVYVTYIRTTRQKVWDALTDPEVQRSYWFGMHQETDWKPGSSWKMVSSEGRVTDAGEVIEFDPPSRLVLKWRNEFRPELTAEGFSRCVMELASEGGLVKLSITHTVERENSKLIEAVSGGWPRILSSLKSLLETGESLPDTRQLPKG